jgi:DNA-binding transcriptional ArsR family regulator
MTEQTSGDVFAAIADPTRRQLLALLAQGEQTVGALTQPFPMSRTAVAKHLHILQAAGLAVERKAGRERRWRLRPEPLREVKDWLSFYETFWNQRLIGLGTYLEQKAGGRTDEQD